jgi:hypothetical protein
MVYIRNFRYFSENITIINNYGLQNLIISILYGAINFFLEKLQASNIRRIRSVLQRLMEMARQCLPFTLLGLGRLFSSILHGSINQCLWIK